MSLLMEALKKAEKSRAGGHPGEARPASLPTMPDFQEARRQEAEADEQELLLVIEEPEEFESPLTLEAKPVEVEIEVYDAALGRDSTPGYANIGLSQDAPSAEDVAVQPGSEERPPVAAEVSADLPRQHGEVAAACRPARLAQPDAARDGVTAPRRAQLASRGQAANVFAAKQATVRPRRKLPIWVGVAAGILLVAGVQGYRVWRDLTLSSLAPLVAEQPVSAQPAAVQPVPVTSGEDQEAQTEALSTQLPVSPDKASIGPPPGEPDPAETAKPKQPTGVFAGESSLGASSAPLPSRAAAPSRLPVESGGGVTIQHAPVASTVGADLANAYQAFMRGDLAGARQGYHQVLRRDADNRDAQLGLAALAVNDGRMEEAAGIYARLLERDPRDDVAQSAMLAMGAGGDHGSTEGRLKTLLAQRPDSDSLHFALGNFYLTQSRFAEAQQSFFNAFRIDAANPDYAFNLAVSLEHLHQPRLAVDYYRKALQLSEQRPASFDRENTLSRLAQLQGGEQ